MSKSSVSFVQGIHVSYGPGATKRGFEQWYLIGYVDNQPFYLHYIGRGATSWEARIDLTPMLRKRILARFKKEVRGQTQPWLQELVSDLLELLESPSTPAQQALMQTCMDFHTTAWRDKMLDDRDEDYIALNVPYDEREQAKAAGAVWRPDRRTWVVHKSANVGAVARWLV